MKNKKLETISSFEDVLVERGRGCWQTGGTELSCSATWSSGCGVTKAWRGEKHTACPAPPKACSFITCERNLQSNKYPMKEDFGL